MTSFLYAHGFASGPRSTKGCAVRDGLAGLGFRCDLLDLRVPNRDHLRLSAMIEVVQAASRALPQPNIAIGSSLGGLTVARAAEREATIKGLVLLAPAFCFAQRWQQLMRPEDWLTWQKAGTWPFADHTKGEPLQVDFGFIDDMIAVDGDASPAPENGLGARWPDVRVPTVIVQGARDLVVNPIFARRFAAARSHVKYVEVDDDHQLHASVPQILEEIELLLARFPQNS